jgi:hypothetical protein
MDIEGTIIAEAEKSSCEWKMGISRLRAQQVFWQCVDQALSKAKCSRPDVSGFLLFSLQLHIPRHLFFIPI